MGIQRSFDLTRLAGDMVRLKAARHGQNKAKARQLLIERLGKLHGLPQKMAQLLSLNELSQSEQVFTPLTEYEGTLSLEEIEALLVERLEQPISEIFQSLDEMGISASVGQVHKAHLLDGSPVAVKVQYPEMEAALDNDLKALGWLSAPIAGLKKMNLQDFQTEITDQIGAELNYSLEGETLARFESHIKRFSHIAVPHYFQDYSTDKVLVSSWLEGSSFSEVIHWSTAERQAIASALVDFFLHSVFVWRELHADPNPGNYRFQRQEPFLQVLDFGCVKKVSEVSARVLYQLISELRTSEHLSASSLAEAYIQLGFSAELIQPMQDRLDAFSRALFLPFISDEVTCVEDWQLSQRLKEALGEDRFNFRLAAPASLLFFVRSYQGLFQYLKALDVPLACYDAFSKLPSLAAVYTRVSEPKEHPQAVYLRIEVLTAGEPTLSLKYRAALLEEIEEIIPDEILDLIERREIDLEGIKQEASEKGYRPGALFSLDELDKEIRVFLG